MTLTFPNNPQPDQWERILYLDYDTDGCFKDIWSRYGPGDATLLRYRIKELRPVAGQERLAALLDLENAEVRRLRLFSAPDGTQTQEQAELECLVFHGLRRVVVDGFKMTPNKYYLEVIE